MSSQFRQKVSDTVDDRCWAAGCSSGDSRGVVECLEGGGDGCKAWNEEVVSIDKAYEFQGKRDVAKGCL